MSQISKYPISGAVAERIFEVLVKTLVSVRDKNEADNLIYDLFSPTEKVMFAKRIAIAFLLLKAYKYRTISGILRVSLTTIASVNLSLRHGRGGYEKILNKIAAEEKLGDFFSGIIEKILAAPAASGKGGAMWRYLRDEVKKERRKRKRTLIS